METSTSEILTKLSTEQRLEIEKIKKENDPKYQKLKKEYLETLLKSWTEAKPELEEFYRQTIQNSEYQNQASTEAAIAILKQQSIGFSATYFLLQHKTSIGILAVMLLVVIIFIILSFNTEGKTQIAMAIIAGIGSISWIGLVTTFLISIRKE